MSRFCPSCHITPLPKGTVCEHCLISRIRHDCEARVAEIQRRQAQSANEIAAKIADIERETIEKSRRIMDEANRRCADLRHRHSDLMRAIAIEQQAPNPDDPNAPVVGCVTEVLTRSTMQNRECCPICYGDFDGTTKYIQLSCSHTFHFDCLNAWIQKSMTCPECRRPIQNISQ